MILYALRYSAKNGHLDIVKYLVENGANIHAQDDYALLFGRSYKKIEIFF